MENIKSPLVFTEWHHGALFQAMVNLFEKRLGGMVFAPVGFEWQKEGYWRLSPNSETIKQYLDPASCLPGSDGWLYYYDPAELRVQRRITLDQFKETEFDIILCTLQEHETSFWELWKKYQPQAKYIRLTGNWGEKIDWSRFSNFIDTTGLYQPPATHNSVVINQEFPLEYFYYSEPVNHKRIANFMNLLRESPAIQIWERLKGAMPDFDFKMYGAGGDDGNITGLDKLGQAMRDSAFFFHVKHHGEGFGHVIHNAYAVGRPVITLFEHYRGKLASRFLINDYSAILIDDYDLSTLTQKIRFWSEPKNHKKMCENARDLFKKYVNFDEDERKIREFIKKLK